jgi:xyloglucan-specific exo-beta-1,4-glucanase
MRYPSIFGSIVLGILPLGEAAYSWKNVKIGGGGGFVPGIVFNEGAKGVAYARTDIGGLYKLNDDDSWTPLTDKIATNAGWHNWGIDAVATDPKDPKRVYAAVGLYTNSWDPDNGAIIRSSDYGATWSFTNLTFKVGGNMPGRGMGERLAIDPNNNKVLFFGARSGNGLWKSADQGESFSKVSSFTATGSFVADPTDANGYNSDKQGLAWVTFNKNSNLTNGATSQIFVGTAELGNSVYVSNDAGSTWSAVAGQPTGLLPHKGKIAPDGNLYVTYSNGSGPYDGTTGAVWKYNLASKSWTNITPTSGSDLYYGFGGLAIDAKKPGTIMVAALNSWWPDLIIFRSNNSGATWSRIWDWNGYPNQNLYYSYNTAKAPWITASRLSTDTKVLGWMAESLEIDPFDSNHWLYGTGLTVYGGHDLLKWDTIHNVSISSLADGIEETAVQDLITPPGGPQLLSAIGDVGGFVHKSLTSPPAVAYLNPLFATTTSMDYAGNKVNKIVRIGNDGSSSDKQIATSNDAGSSWSPFSGANTGQYGGKVAMSADGDAILWSSASSGVLVSQNSGIFAAPGGSLPSGAAVAADKRNGTVFYAASASTFYRSTDTGKSFVKAGSLGSSNTVVKIVSNPTATGDIWVSTDKGLFHSTDYGTTFSQISSSSVTQGYAFALGKGPKTYWSIYGFFNIGGNTDLYSSNDNGTSWKSISSPDQGFGSAGSCVVAASPDTEGLVYVGTNGRGIFYSQDL